jgi:hypothetical protein
MQPSEKFLMTSERERKRREEHKKPLEKVISHDAMDQLREASRAT